MSLHFGQKSISILLMPGIHRKNRLSIANLKQIWTQAPFRDFECQVLTKYDKMSLYFGPNSISIQSVNARYCQKE